MPFSRDYHYGRFKTAELENLQAAYLKTCEALGHCPITSPQKDHIAHQIIQIYECGVSNPDKIAELMVQIESVKPKPLVEELFTKTSATKTRIA
ncbi:MULTISPECIES: hypothetical protein [Brucella]|uniref:Uncharacterized protein n=16 Tax=Brucella TaxID=234 RepID=Q2YKC0_BRUA2|nr:MULTISPECIES: hypothetical protein [Brucella]ERM87623.1 hypothetical protein P865_01885 [Brucella abortus 82]ERT80969.1 hypothetical protein P050_02541 [Brucella abortus 90-12178]ERU06147.1 hypothetical protein P038_00885 [Brucella abortus 99-9971-135]ERU10994.1 hypothetical protein P039_00356 [Brucella abortus 07-0994-2411]KEX99691.1 hypothetical protein IL60_0209340 [Brucella inopinata BO1]KFH23599.1 hypothetical protein IB60_03370 [Brucella abortus LMN1]KFH25085.1 hypothetical protein 